MNTQHTEVENLGYRVGFLEGKVEMLEAIAEELRNWDQATTSEPFTEEDWMELTRRLTRHRDAGVREVASMALQRKTLFGPSAVDLEGTSFATD